jgi:hypothetical protein
MIQYPSIPNFKYVELDRPFMGFPKYDGSNLRWGWSSNKGWHKAGTRTRYFDRTDTEFGEAFTVFPQLEAELGRFVKDNKRSSIVAFTEFLGPNSFAGIHRKEDPKSLILFDIAVNDEILNPKDFMDITWDIKGAAKVICQTILDEELINRVQTGDFDVTEGIICKGTSRRNPWMAKIKTLSYLAKLKEVYAGNWEEIWES